MSYGNHRTFVLLNVVLEPGNGFRIEMVCGFIEQKNVGLLKQETTERDTPLFAAGQNGRLSCPAEDIAAHPSPFQAANPGPTLRWHRVSPGPCPGVRAAPAISSSDIGSPNLAFISSNSAADRQSAALLVRRFPGPFCRIEVRLLLEVTNGIAGRNSRLTLELLIHTGQDPKQGALTRPIEPDDTDLGAVEVRQIDVLEDSFLVVELAYSNHGVNDFIGSGAQKLARASCSDWCTSKTVYSFVNCSNSVTCVPGLLSFNEPHVFR